MDYVNNDMGDYQTALDCYEWCLKVQEKDPSTLTTFMNMEGTHMDGLKDFPKAKEMYRMALKWYERSLGKEQEDTKNCAKNLAFLLLQQLKSIEKTREMKRRFSNVLEEGGGLGEVVKNFIK